jgi:Periplasmic binding protein
MELNGYSRVLISVCIVAVTSSTVAAQKSNAPGVTDTEIKVGQTMPYSGPASAWGAVGRAELAYFKMINEQGGINGRKINLISLDDAPKNTPIRIYGRGEAQRTTRKRNLEVVR